MIENLVLPLVVKTYLINIPVIWIGVDPLPVESLLQFIDMPDSHRSPHYLTHVRHQNINLWKQEKNNYVTKQLTVKQDSVSTFVTPVTEDFLEQEITQRVH